MDHFDKKESLLLGSFNSELQKLLNKYFIRGNTDVSAFKLSSFEINRAVVVSVKTIQASLRNEPLKTESDPDCFDTRKPLDPKAWGGD